MPRPPVRLRASTPRTLAATLVGVLVAALLSIVAPTASHAADLPASILEGGFIISDAEYFDSDSMTAAQIQTFLNARVPTCKATTGPTCLKNFKTALPKKAADTYCREVAAKSSATAAEIIAAVSRACGISPKVILVMLQKEQGLVTSTAPSDWSYRAAMGQSCPDTAPCDAAAAGFVNQVYLGARQQQVYTKKPTSFNYRAGQVNTIKWHPNSSCGTSKVYIQNQATANLYIYTPYRPNIAALAAGYGTGDNCSTYGNRNFYNYYVDWFAPEASSSTGAPAKVPACTVPVAADVAAASGTATVTAAATVRTAPTTLCGTGSMALAKGASLTVTGAYGTWIRATSAGKTYWAPKSSLSVSVPAPAAGGDVCALPSTASITPASGTVMVTTETLNARKAPSTSCEIGKTQMTMGSVAPRTGTYGEWWRITLNGSAYWVHSAYVEVQKPVDPPAQQQLYAKSALHIRSAPSASGAVRATLITGEAVRASDSVGTWRYVSAGAAEGWVDGTHLAAQKPPAGATSAMKTTTALNLRTAAVVGGTVIVTLAKDTAVTVIDSAGAWRAVTVGSRTGWVDGAYLRADAPPAAPQTLFTSTAVHLRSSAAPTATPVVTLQTGTEVSVLASSGTWRQVAAGTSKGWVSTAHLVADQPAAPATSSMQTSTALNLRTTASTAGAVITTLAPATRVKVTDATGVWRAVTVGDRSGWVDGTHLAAETLYTRTAQHLASSPSETAAPVMTLQTGTAVTVTGESGTWLSVQAGSSAGWLDSAQLVAQRPAMPATSVMQTTAALNLRTTAVVGGAVIVTLERGTKVTVTDAMGTWRAVTVGSRSGWVDGAHLGAETAPLPSTLYAKVAVHLRASASASAAPVGTLSTGTRVTVEKSSGTWMSVTTGSLRGWVDAAHLVTQKPAARATTAMQTTAALNLRTTAVAGGTVIVTLAKGTKVTVTDATGSWRAVTVGSRTGWVDGRHLAAATTVAPVVKTTTSALNLRASASTSAKILTVLAKGTKVTVVGSSGAWSRVTVGGQTGWVSASYLK